MARNRKLLNVFVNHLNDFFFWIQTSQSSSKDTYIMNLMELMSTYSPIILACKMKSRYNIPFLEKEVSMTSQNVVECLKSLHNDREFRFVL